FLSVFVPFTLFTSYLLLGLQTMNAAYSLTRHTSPSVSDSALGPPFPGDHEEEHRRSPGILHIPETYCATLLWSLIAGVFNSVSSFTGNTQRLSSFIVQHVGVTQVVHATKTGGM
ncbi:MAG: hypothetical protein MUQ10_16015, partial [Anaerolineae bacterium]|nr:hypothetical protein [Anaerolineae bacterium]